jgi:ribosomal protein S18 acetylase RimI-like enzyme
MTRISLRPATSDDSEFVYRTKRASLREYVERTWGWNEGEQRELHSRRFAKRAHEIIRVAGADIGVLVKLVEPDCLRLLLICLIPEHQGRGLGRECMTGIMEEARRRRLPLRLRVLKANPRALAFYERLGFTRTGETDDHHEMGWCPPPADDGAGP